MKLLILSKEDERMKKVMSLVLTVAMLVCFMPTMAFAAEKNWDDNGKIYFALESGDTTASVTAYDDYSVVAKIVGEKVDANSATATLKMKNIAGLGITGLREASYTLNTGIDLKGIPLSAALQNLFAFESAVLEGKVDNLDFSYALEATDKNPSTFTVEANPIGGADKVRAAWQKLVDMVEVTAGTDDSKIFIPAGAYIKIGYEKLIFDKDCTVNPSSQNGLGGSEAAIRDAAHLETGVTTENGNNIEIYLPKGSSLQVSSSAATLKRGVTVRSDLAFSDEIQEPLDTLRTADDARAVIAFFVKMFDDAVGQANGQTVNVTILGDYDITFINEGTKTVETAKFGESVSLPAETPEKENATFDGWYIGDTRVTGTVRVTGDMEVVARFTDNQPVTPPVGPTTPTTPVDPEPPTDIEDPDTPLGPLPDEEVIAAVQGAKIKLASKLTTLNGKKAVKVTWTVPSAVEELELDGYEVYKSTKRYSGFGKIPYFKTTTKKNYINNKELKKGRTYYYKVRGYKVVGDQKIYTPWSTKAWRRI